MTAPARSLPRRDPGPAGGPAPRRRRDRRAGAAAGGARRSVAACDGAGTRARPWPRRGPRSGARGPRRGRAGSARPSCCSPAWAARSTAAGRSCRAWPRAASPRSRSRRRSWSTPAGARGRVDVVVLVSQSGRSAEALRLASRRRDGRAVQPLRGDQPRPEPGRRARRDRPRDAGRSRGGAVDGELHGLHRGPRRGGGRAPGGTANEVAVAAAEAAPSEARAGGGGALVDHAAGRRVARLAGRPPHLFVLGRGARRPWPACPRSCSRRPRRPRRGDVRSHVPAWAAGAGGTRRRGRDHRARPGHDGARRGARDRPAGRPDRPWRGSARPGRRRPGAGLPECLHWRVRPLRHPGRGAAPAAGVAPGARARCPGTFRVGGKVTTKE